MRVISAVLLGGFGVAALLFYGAGSSRRIHPLDNYAGGHFLYATNHYHYSNHFYAGLMRLIGPWYRQLFVRLERLLLRSLRLLADLSHGLFFTEQALPVVVLTLLSLLWWGGVS